MPEDKDALRRRWAEDQISGLEKQRDGINRRIDELRSFVALLDASEAALRAPQLAFSVHPTFNVRLIPTERKSLADWLIDALSTAGQAGMTIREVAEKLKLMGYEYRGSRRFETLIGSELHRQARTGRRGVVKLGTARYGIRAA